MAESEAPRATENRSTTPVSSTFKQYISEHWAERADALPQPREQAPFAAARRAAISALHPGKRLIIPAGAAKTRSNDTDYAYRAHSAFAHLTGWGSDSVAGSVLVLEPTPDGHDATLYFREAAGRDSDEFYANPEIGEFWTGPRPSLAHVAADLGLATRELGALGAVIEAVDADTVILRDGDRDLTDQVDGRRLLAADTESLETDADAELARNLSELRLVKDAYEIRQMRLAVAATKQGFDDVIADLGEITAHPRGERLVEGTFNRRARAEGNTVGYDTIAASGPHACILHWTRNDGPVAAGDLILVDAGIELDSLYTADITRTLPVGGTFTEVQRRVYEAVREAADAAFAIVRPGIRFRQIHETAMAVIARRTAEWGLLPVSAEESLDPAQQYHRRYMVHGTSHHLGIDVHDCAQARRELYLEGELEAGMVFTIEPGLYFQPDDLTVPEEYRGIGVRIEDNILVTESGAENLSIAIPRTADEVEAWLARNGRAG
ncbi:aminopeptidase P family protein [Galbitalea soli]|uniref:Xaa-Pro aminopeptidase n=1 Tax=Galbitalea soli TaxID=1268042 RepID=A0A7C9TPY3_9MICO|nr:aminopeptidase P family protein [Galbitalea soli]NEM90599.1 aminopeptidase P family protein [Galbitalea soli]NYJ31315.1 Xaa-Pro aminopeptidase [Galbitalea soli]